MHLKKASPRIIVPQRRKNATRRKRMQFTMTRMRMKLQEIEHNSYYFEREKYLLVYSSELRVLFYAMSFSPQPKQIINKSDKGSSKFHREKNG